MRLTLPKKLLRYIQPHDREHEARLALIWLGYRRYVRERDGAPSEKMERAVLGEVFQIPENQWHRFRPKPPDPHAKSRNAYRWLAEEYKKSQCQLQSGNRPKKSSKPKPAEPKKPMVILRKQPPQE